MCRGRSPPATPTGILNISAFFKSIPIRYLYLQNQHCCSMEQRMFDLPKVEHSLRLFMHLCETVKPEILLA
jgi:hypothetical protein